MSDWHSEPPDLNAESATFLLCALLYQDGHRWADVRVRPAQLPPGPYAVLFDVLADLHGRGVKPELLLVRAELEKRGADIGDQLGYIIATGRAENMEEYQRLILTDHDRRRMEYLCQTIGDHLDRGEIAEAVAAVGRAQDTDAPAGSQEAKAVLWRVMEKVEKPDPWLETGLEPLDYRLDGGVRPGEVVVIACRPGVGKSAFALQAALHIAGEGNAVSLWSLEMSQEQWMRRALAATARVSMRGIRRGELSESDMVALAHAAGPLNDLPIHFASGYDTTPSGFRLEATKHVRHFGSRVLIVDYLQLMQPDRRANSREQEVAAMSRENKRTALQLGVPIIVLAQLNRDADGRIPTLANLRESGAVEQDADIVFFLHREMDEETQALKQDGLGIVAKNRDAETGAFPLWYDRAYYRFTAMETRLKEPASNARRPAAWYEREEA